MISVIAAVSCNRQTADLDNGRKIENLANLRTDFPLPKNKIVITLEKKTNKISKRAQMSKYLT